MDERQRTHIPGEARSDGSGPHRSEPHGDSGTNRLAWRLLLIAGSALCAAGLVYVLGACTRWGQRIGDGAYAGRLESSPELRRGALDVLETLRGSSIVLIGGGAILVALARRRPRLALIVALVMAVSILGGEFLKRSLVRPDFGIDPPGMTANWAPSGHATVAMTLVLCVLLVVPDQLRVVVAVVGSIYSALIASGTLAAGWHRPVDAIMASMWSFGIATLAVSALVAWRGVGADDDAEASTETRRIHRAVIALVVALPVALILGAFLREHDSVLWTQPSGRFVLASVLIDLVAVASVVMFARLLRGLSLDRPGREEARGSEPIGDLAARR